MVIVKISDGLGNQMFQYAFSHHLLCRNLDVKYDLSFFKRQKIHNGFELEKVFEKIRLTQVTRRDIIHFVESERAGKEKRYLLKDGRHIFKERFEDQFKYNNFENGIDNTYFSGIWQHYNYFKDNAAQLRRHFSFKPIIRSETINSTMLADILQGESVGIHIRRGDYLNSFLHKTLDVNYYNSAIEIIATRISNPKFYIFSDDINWAKQHINSKEAIFVSHNTGINSFRDMQLMSLCKNNIIANSTFSWWSAWLNVNPNKIVIMPQKWFKQDKDISGLYYPDWIKI